MDHDDEAVILFVVAELHPPGPELIGGVLVRKNRCLRRIRFTRRVGQSLKNVEQQFAEPPDLLLLHPGYNRVAVDDDEQSETSLAGFTQSFRPYKLNIDRFDLAGTFVHVLSRLQRLAVACSILGETAPIGQMVDRTRVVMASTDIIETHQQAQPESTAAIPTLEQVRDDEEVQAYIRQANKNLGAAGYTEHGFRHVGLCANIARNVLRLLGYSQRDQELAAIAAYLHDIGNVISRSGHSISGALLAKPILQRLGMSWSEIAVVLGAIGAHDTDEGMTEPISPISAALILADKTDVHRSRVRNPDPATFDQHDRVNYAATASFLRVNADEKTITLELAIDVTIAPVMHYFEIFLPRMLMCRRAAEHLGCAFHITMNDVSVL